MEVFSNEFQVQLFKEVSELQAEVVVVLEKLVKVKTKLAIGISSEGYKQKNINLTKQAIIDAYVVNRNFNKSLLAKKLNVSRQYIYQVVNELKKGNL